MKEKEEKVKLECIKESNVGGIVVGNIYYASGKTQWFDTWYYNIIINENTILYGCDNFKEVE